MPRRLVFEDPVVEAAQDKLWKEMCVEAVGQLPNLKCIAPFGGAATKDFPALCGALRAGGVVPLQQQVLAATWEDIQRQIGKIVHPEAMVSKRALHRHVRAWSRAFVALGVLLGCGSAEELRAKVLMADSEVMTCLSDKVPPPCGLVLDVALRCCGCSGPH